MSIYHKVVKNVFTNWMSLGLNLIISFFLAPFVVNKLGSTFYGIWVIMMQLTGYLYLLDFGIRESVIRYVSKYIATNEQGKISEVVSSALKVYGFVSLLCLIVTGVLAAVFPSIFNLPNEVIPTARMVIIITGFNMAQFFVFNVFTGVLMGAQRYDVFNKISIIFALIRVALIVNLLNMGYGIIALALIQLGINLVSNIIVFISTKNIVEFVIDLSQKLSDQKKTIRLIINYSFFVLITNICQKIIFYTDALVIGIFLPAAAITYYAIAGNLIEYLRRFVISMANVLNPLSSEMAAKKEDDKLIDVLIQGTKISLLIGMPVCVVYYILGERFIFLWMGEEFAVPAAQVLAILSVTHLFSLPHFTVSMILYGTSRHNIIAYSKIGESVANLALSLALVKSYGIIGVAIGTAIPHLFTVTIIFPYLICRIVKVELATYYLKAYIGPILSAIPFALLCLYARTHINIDSLIVFFLILLVILPTYYLPAWFISFRKEERVWHISMLRPIFNKIKN